ncbi:MAG: 3-deoxy-D-manno-octulosonic acid transferase [Bacteroidia bacterium]|nr:3-deoxy-D-manno-octulosonic acid transferase [Bacteroidia bacterium]
MKFLYTLGIFSYGLAIRIASLFNSKAKLWVNGRRNLFENLNREISNSTSPVIWFHCASLGEFEQGRPLIEKIRVQKPDHRILLTFFSPSGYEVRKNYNGADIVTYIPLDTKSKAKRFVEIVKPSLVVFVKYEFWLNHLAELSARKIPHYLVAAIFREDQIFFKNRGGIFRQCLHNYTHIFTQNSESEKLVKSVGVKHVTAAGDTRFDRVKEIASQAKSIELAAAFIGESRKVLVAGSTWSSDEEHLFPAFVPHISAGWKMIIAPHEIGMARVNEIIRSLENLKIQRSEIVRYSEATENTIHNAKVLIIDNIGMLSSLYRYGSVAYIGGGFGKSIHNTLEAAVYAVPVIFGPAFGKFNEAIQLIECGGGYGVNSPAELKTVLNQILGDENLRGESGTKAGNYVNVNTGATEKILSVILA